MATTVTREVLAEECQASSMALVRTKTFGDVALNQRRDDGYLDTATVCKFTGKQWGHYYANKGTKAFLRQAASDLGIPISDLIQIRKGQAKGAKQGAGQGTWIHPDIAVHFIFWASPKFAVQACHWIRELLTTGKVELAPQCVESPVAIASLKDVVRAEVIAELAPLVAEVRALLPKSGTGPRLEGPFWTVAAWLDENMPQWEASPAQRHAIGQGAKNRIKAANPKEQVGYFNRDLAFQAQQEYFLAQAARHVFNKSLREGKLKLRTPGLYDEIAAA